MSTTDGYPIPAWLSFVLRADRAGSAWYIGTGFFFAPVLAMISPWPTVTAALWVLIGLAGLWLGVLGVAMAIGLSLVLRTGGEIDEDYWHTIIDYPPAVRKCNSGCREARDTRRLSECRIDDGRLVAGRR